QARGDPQPEPHGPWDHLPGDYPHVGILLRVLSRLRRRLPLGPHTERMPGPDGWGGEPPPVVGRAGARVVSISQRRYCWGSPRRADCPRERAAASQPSPHRERTTTTRPELQIVYSWTKSRTWRGATYTVSPTCKRSSA